MSASHPALEPVELQELRIRLRDQCEAVACALLGEPIVRTRKEWRWGLLIGNHRALACCLAPQRPTVPARSLMQPR